MFTLNRSARSSVLDRALANETTGLQPPLGRNLTYSLLDKVGSAIVTGHYDGRPFPTEADLASQYGVSRSVTREAVKMLTAKGLLSARPRQGTSVQPSRYWNLFDVDILRWILERQFSIDLLRHFSELRIAIEPEGAALAARFGSIEDHERITSGLRRMKAADIGLDDVLDSDIAFHVAILQATNNPFYVQFRGLVETALRTSIRFTNRIKGRTASVEDHAAVHDAILQRDPATARRAMHDLIADVIELVEEVGETETKR